MQWMGSISTSASFRHVGLLQKMPRLWQKLWLGPRSLSSTSVTFVVPNTRPRSQLRNTCSATVRLSNTLSVDNKIVEKSLSLRKTWTCISRIIPCQRYTCFSDALYMLHDEHCMMYCYSEYYSCTGDMLNMWQTSQARVDASTHDPSHWQENRYVC